MVLRMTRPGIAVVTGASSGIGRSSAVALANVGWTVVLSGRRNDALRETQSLMAEPGRKRSRIFPGDLEKHDAVVSLFKFVKAEFGRIDLLFNNADVPQSSFASLLNINIAAPFWCTQEAFKLMKTQKPKGGRIINNGSVSSQVPRPQSAPYTMSKHAISGLTKSTALDGRRHKIACSQLDIGNAESVLSVEKTVGVLQADLSLKSEPVMDVDYAGAAIVFMASLPLEVNILSQTLMATAMPLVGRG
ncbi:short-chain dehydrogenase/reductase SDR [Meredithblackwellia eburnea MCA 4105]